MCGFSCGDGGVCVGGGMRGVRVLFGFSRHIAQWAKVMSVFKSLQALRGSFGSSEPSFTHTTVGKLKC